MTHRKEYWHRWYETNKEKQKALSRERSMKLKLEVVTHYGNGQASCLLCEESRLACLSIDHIGGNGNRHFKELHISAGSHFYRWLKKNGFPEGFQTLCMNCQMVKRVTNNEYRKVTQQVCQATPKSR